MNTLATVKYETGDATDPQGSGPKIIAHVCNDRGGWAAGFVMAISHKWSKPEECYRDLAKRGLELGQVQMVMVDEARGVHVANMISQVLRDPTGVNIRYDALRRCLKIVADEATRLGASVHMPRIGCGLAGGQWTEIEPLIQQELCQRGIVVTVYDFIARTEG